MALAIRTLALPADVLAMGAREIVRLANGERILRFARGKTGIRVEVELVGEFATVIDEALAENVVHPTVVHRRDGKPYTRDGIAAMFRRHCVEAKVADFGLRDLRAKGATDMFRAKIPIGTIQLLLGHASVQTTEIYLKELIPQSVRPNETAIIGA
jgi:integrase